MATNRETKDRERTRSYAGTDPQGTAYTGSRDRSTSLAQPSSNMPRYGSVSTPFSVMRRMLEDMDRMFSDFGGTSPMSGPHLERSLWTPQVETFRRGDQLVVRADLPGMTKDNVNVDVENDALVISGERQDEHQEERDDYYRSERSYGSFYRAIPLPDGVDPNSIKAEYKEGVLEVTMPAPRQSEQRRRIDIK